MNGSTTDSQTITAIPRASAPSEASGPPMPESIRAGQLAIEAFKMDVEAVVSNDDLKQLDRLPILRQIKEDRKLNGQGQTLTASSRKIKLFFFKTLSRLLFFKKLTRVNIYTFIYMYHISIYICIYIY